ncbi:MAG: PspC domain-containing protein [Candidatus Atribacteria bacterium]|nr:MAG: PspC domain-containing protein [Candidatus Atribacteria bacterium]
MERKLYRSKNDSMLGGVCGGLGAYFNFDPNLIRLIFVVLAVAPGIGIPAYIALWLLVPEEEERESTSLGERVREGADEIAERARSMGDKIRDRSGHATPVASFAFGAILIAVGIGFLLRNLGFTWINWVAKVWVWPSLLILVGLVFLWRWIRDRTN